MQIDLFYLFGHFALIILFNHLKKIMKTSTYENHTLQVYSGMIEALDRSVGKIVKALEENGLSR